MRQRKLLVHFGRGLWGGSFGLSTSGSAMLVIQDEATSFVLERLVRITSSMLPNNLEGARGGNLPRNWQICLVGLYVAKYIGGKMRNGIDGFCRRTRRLFNLSESPFLWACPQESVGTARVAEHASLHGEIGIAACRRHSK